MQKRWYVRNPKTDEMRAIPLNELIDYRASGWEKISEGEFREAQRAARNAEDDGEPQISEQAQALAKKAKKEQFQKACDTLEIEYKQGDGKPLLAQKIIDSDKSDDEKQQALNKAADS